MIYLNSDMGRSDKREKIYCRTEISIKQITPYMKKDVLQKNAKYWIYVAKPTQMHRPSKQNPIIQSYVDIFIGGCVEQAARIANKKVSNLKFNDDYGYVFDCINTTKGWTTDFWLNDRVYPQRPWVMSPYSRQIDRALSQSYQSGYVKGKLKYKNIQLKK